VSSILVLVGLIGLCLGAFAAIRGRLGWAHINSRRQAGVATFAAVVVLVVGGAITPKPASTTASTKSSSSPASTVAPAASPSTGSAQSPTRTSVTASSTSPRATDATASSTTAGLTLTGYGATEADWAAHHTPDNRFDPGAVWDPMPGWGTDPQHDAKFFMVSYESGRVLSYSMNMPSHASKAEALQVVLSAMPTDTKVLWSTTRVAGQCFQAELQSRQLGSVLSAPSIGDADGEVFVELDSDDLAAGNPYWDPSHVTEAIVMLGSYSTPSKAPAC